SPSAARPSTDPNAITAARSKVDMLESIRCPTILMSTTIARYIPAVPSTVAMASAGVTQSSSSMVIPVPPTSSSLSHTPHLCTCFGQSPSAGCRVLIDQVRLLAITAQAAMKATTPTPTNTITSRIRCSVSPPVNTTRSPSTRYDIGKYGCIACNGAGNVSTG